MISGAGGGASSSKSLFLGLKNDRAERLLSLRIAMGLCSDVVEGQRVGTMCLPGSGMICSIAAVESSGVEEVPGVGRLPSLRCWEAISGRGKVSQSEKEKRKNT